MRHPSPNFPCPAIATRIWGRYHHPKDGTLGSFSDPAWICLVAKHVCSPKTEIYNLNLTSCGELKNFISSHLGLVGIQAFWKWCWLGVPWHPGPWPWFRRATSSGRQLNRIRGLYNSIKPYEIPYIYKWWCSILYNIIHIYIYTLYIYIYTLYIYIHMELGVE